MAAEPNVGGMARLLYLAVGVAASSWGLWWAEPGWAQWFWLALGGTLLVLGLIGYSPIHAWFLKKERKEN